MRPPTGYAQERLHAASRVDHEKILRSTAKGIHYNIYEYCFTSLSAQSWQYRDRRKPEAGTTPYSYFE